MNIAASAHARQRPWYTAVCLRWTNIGVTRVRFTWGNRAWAVTAWAIPTIATIICPSIGFRVPGKVRGIRLSKGLLPGNRLLLPGALPLLLLLLPDWPVRWGDRRCPEACYLEPADRFASRDQCCFLADGWSDRCDSSRCCDLSRYCDSSRCCDSSRYCDRSTVTRFGLILRISFGSVALQLANYVVQIAVSRVAITRIAVPARRGAVVVTVGIVLGIAIVVLTEVIAILYRVRRG